MINSIKKGKNFERQIAKYLTECSKFPWIRVPCSGATSTSQGTVHFKGNVFTEHPDYCDIVIECKSIKRICWNDFWNDSTSYLARIVAQTTSESASRSWLLFIKPNNQGIFLMTTREGARLIKELNLKVHEGFISWNGLELRKVIT